MSNPSSPATRSVATLAGEPLIVATYFTHAGNVSLSAENVASPWPLQRRAEALGRAGFRGMGFVPDDLDRILADTSLTAVRALLADNGLGFIELEALTDWFATGERRQRSDLQRRRMLDYASQLGAVHIKAVGELGDSVWPLERMIEGFAELCDAAAEAGTAVTMELFPSSNVRDLETGRAIVEGAGRRNGGLLLDIWHMTRGGVDYAKIAALPPGLITHVELDDADPAQIGTIMEDTIARRRLCGEGSFDITAFLRSIVATGYQGAYGVEILSDEQRARTPEEVAERTYSTTRRCFDARK